MTTQNNSLRSQVFTQIRQDILCGKYRRGDELIESALGMELGVSRTPVREALRQLALEGLIEIVPNKGAFVTGISAKDVKDIYMIRSRLEGLCARWAAKNSTEQELEEMEETMYLSQYHAEREHYEQVFEMDGRFHKLLYEASHSRMLAHELSDFHQYVQMVRKLSITNRLRSRKSNEEHQKIVEALRARDQDLAEQLATQHILNTMENISHYDIESLLGKEQMTPAERRHTKEQ